LDSALPHVLSPVTHVTSCRRAWRAQSNHWRASLVPTTVAALGRADLLGASGVLGGAGDLGDRCDDGASGLGRGDCLFGCAN
jgi:hypothetical protein